MNLKYQIKKCINFPEMFEIKLFKIFLELNKMYGATYMSYTFDKLNEVRYSFRSDSNWASIYEKEEIFGKPIMELCPLDKISRERKNMFILWDLYRHESQPKIDREIMQMREEVGLQHGITLSTHFNGHNDALAIASDDNKNDLAMRVLLKENGLILKEKLLTCRKMYFDTFINSTDAILL